MRQIRKSIKLDRVCYEIRGPLLKEAKRLEDEGFTIIKLNTGNPPAGIMMVALIRKAAPWIRVMLLAGASFP